MADSSPLVIPLAPPVSGRALTADIKQDDFPVPAMEWLTAMCSHIPIPEGHKTEESRWCGTTIILPDHYFLTLSKLFFTLTEQKIASQPTIVARPGNHEAE